MAQPRLAVSDLSVHYDRGTPVLRGLTLSLAPGDALVVVGPNGSGKSTLLHAIVGGLVAQIAGDIALNGQSLARMARHRRAREMAMVHQDPARGTAAHLSLREHCALTTGVGGRMPVTWDQLDARLEALGTHLEPRRPAGELSGGQRQLFTVLLAILSAPSVLLLDEPTSALDAHHQALVLELIEAYVADPVHATIFVTHDLTEARRIGNRLLVLSARGEILQLLGTAEKKELAEPALVDLLTKAASATWSSTSRNPRAAR